jgi:hypothetical protein
MKKIVVFILLIGCIPFAAHTQDKKVKVSGSVKDVTGKPISFVTVALLTSKDSIIIKGSITDDLGKFELQDVAKEQYMVKYQFVGYKSLFYPLEISGIKDVKLSEIVLEEDFKELAEVTVRAQKMLVERQGDKIMFNVANSILASGGSTLDLLQQAPGVSVDDKEISLNGRSGVQILMDGKPVYLAPEQLMPFLAGLSSNNVSTIEIMTNPSSKYDAAGNAGLINIVTKKNNREGLGTNGSFTQSGGHGRYGKANTSLSLNYSEKKIILYGTYSYKYEKLFFDRDMYRNIITENENLHFDQTNERILTLNSNAWQVGADYYPAKNHSFSLSAKGNSNNRTSTFSNETIISQTEQKNVTGSLDLFNNIHENWSTLSAAFGYKYAFVKPGHELSADIDFSNYYFEQNDNIDINWLDEIGNSTKQIISSNIPTAINIKALKADYVNPLNDHFTLEAGFKQSHVRSNNDILFMVDMLKDDDLTNDFDYNEIVTAGYGNARINFNKTNIRAGLRLEHTNADGTSVANESIIKRNYLQFFPSLSFNRKFSNIYSAEISYNRRIDRPAFNDLYPFILFLDPFLSGRGNPYLMPQLSSSWQLTQVFSKDFVITLNYTHTTDAISPVIVQDEITKVGYSKRVNLDNFYFYSANFIVPLAVNDWWTVNSNITFSYKEYTSNYFEALVNRSLFTGLANIINTLLLPKDFSAEVSLLYQAPDIIGLYRRQARGSFNLGMQKKVFDKKGIVRLSASDLFRTNRIINHIQFEAVDVYINQLAETRMVTGTFTYNFGNAKTKVAKKKGSGIEELQKRINN